MTLTIKQPTSADPARGILTAWGEEDDPNVARVDVSIDRGPFQAAGYTPPDVGPPAVTGSWIMEIYTPDLEDGLHKLNVRALAADGTSSSIVQNFVVQNGLVPLEPFLPAVTADQFYYARLPFLEAQRYFSLRGVLPRSGRRLSVAWHGTVVDRERGSFAVVRSDGVLADWVGSCVKITYSTGAFPRIVYGFVHNIANLKDDVSIPRRSFLMLSENTLDRVTAFVERCR